MDAIKTGNADGVWQRMANVLETVTVKAYPIIEEIKQEMIEEEVESSKILVTGIPLRKKFYYSIPNERNNIKTIKRYYK